MMRMKARTSHPTQKIPTGGQSLLLEEPTIAPLCRSDAVPLVIEQGSRPQAVVLPRLLFDSERLPLLRTAPDAEIVAAKQKMG